MDENTETGRTVIVVPCYNEANRLPVDVFMDYAPRHPRREFLFVDDGSADATYDVLKNLRERRPESFSAYQLAENSGKAEAVRQGVMHVLQSDNKPDYIGYWDADLATPLDAIDEVCDVMDRHQQVEMVMGARVRLLGREVNRRPVRHYLGRAFATLASWVLKIAVYDTQCGAKMFRVTPRLDIMFGQPFLSKWIFDVEILARFLRDSATAGHSDAESRIYEFPLQSWFDVPGSKLKSQDFLTAFFDLLKIHRRYRLRKLNRNRTRSVACSDTTAVHAGPHEESPI